jgi:hypothetical protein
VEVFTGTGAQGQVFKLSPGTGKAVAMTSVSVAVDGVQWTEQEFLTFEQTNQYEVGYNDDPATVRFGDGVAGKIPPLGAEIAVTYVATSGKAGEAPLSGEINALVSPLVVSFTSIRLTVTNPARPSGADDAESIESVKANAPRFFKTRGVAVTREDYETLAGAYKDPLAGAVAAAGALASGATGVEGGSAASSASSLTAEHATGGDGSRHTAAASRAAVRSCARMRATASAPRMVRRSVSERFVARRASTSTSAAPRKSPLSAARA